MGFGFGVAARENPVFMTVEEPRPKILGSLVNPLLELQEALGLAGQLAEEY